MSTIARFSLEEYERMVEAGVFDHRSQRLEFIHGEIREMSPINPPHAQVVNRLVDWSYDNVPRGMVGIRVQVPIRLPESESEPQPDIAWVTKRDYSRQHPGGPAVLLVIEVADSSLATDLGEKADLYAAAGIRDYWVVDLPHRARGHASRSGRRTLSKRAGRIGRRSDPAVGVSRDRPAGGGLEGRGVKRLSPHGFSGEKPPRCTRGISAATVPALLSTTCEAAAFCNPPLVYVLRLKPVPLSCR